MVKIDDILEDIKRDFATFADPTAEVIVSSSSVLWRQSRRDRQVTLVSPSTKGFPDIIEDGIRFTYNDFFASSKMADLKSFAQSVYLQTSVVDTYIRTQAKVDESVAGVEDQGNGTEILRGLATTNLPFLSTRIVFVRGKAGAGKTEMLRQLTREQANRYMSGGGGSIFFYVDAQARALSRLNEAMSLILQDLRASFTYHSVATLTRLGLLIPVIDGFDELLGTGGYREAFSSLSRFLQSLDGGGAMVVSARATFYQFSDFRQAASRLEDARVDPVNYQIVPVTALPWGHKEVASYLTSSSVPDLFGAKTVEESAINLRAKLGTQAELLLDTPFFVARIVDLLKRDPDVDLSGRMVPAIVSDFIDRETRKMIDATGVPLITREQHMTLLEAVAEEMLQQETLALDTGTLRVLVEMVCGDFALNSGAERAVVEKFSSHALLDVARDGGANRVSFHHEFYYAYFLARALATLFQQSAELSGPFGRGGFSAVVCRELVLELKERGVTGQQVIALLGGRRISSLTRDVSRRNVGLLYEEMIKTWPGAVNGALLRQGVFEFASFVGANVDKAVLEECELRGCDFQRSNWVDVDFRTSIVFDARVSSSTRLRGCRFGSRDGVVGLHFVDASGDEATTYSPSLISSRLRELGAALPEIAGEEKLSDSATKAIAALQRFLRMARQTFYFSKDDFENKGLQSMEGWPQVLAALRHEGVVEDTRISRRGSKGDVMKLSVTVEALERGERGEFADNRVQRFWQAIREL